ncbi:hypothetical protein ACP70R_003896 [Stipagrostis hirtigluma subsp. patula]
MGAARRAPAWRSACLALCLLPVALPLALLWLPLLCVAVAAVRFRRRRRRMVAAERGRRSCCARDGGPWPPEAEGAGLHRAALLHKYLEDQMELVGAGAGGRAETAGDAVDRRMSSDPNEATGSMGQETEVLLIGRKKQS